jgi:hypothetical protein
MCICKPFINLTVIICSIILVLFQIILTSPDEHQKHSKKGLHQIKRKNKPHAQSCLTELLNHLPVAKSQRIQQNNRWQGLDILKLQVTIFKFQPMNSKLPWTFQWHTAEAKSQSSLKYRFQLYRFQLLPWTLCVWSKLFLMELPRWQWHMNKQNWQTRK